MAESIGSDAVREAVLDILKNDLSVNVRTDRDYYGTSTDVIVQLVYTDPKTGEKIVISESYDGVSTR